MAKLKTAQTDQPIRQFLCTNCGGDAFLAYTSKPGADWGGKVKPDERLCDKCFRSRSGLPVFR